MTTEQRQSLLPGREGALALVVTAVVLLLRIGFGSQVQFCGTPDSCAYFGLAQSLGRGEGFRAPFLFDLQQSTLSLPTHAIEYWRPGTSFFLLLAKPFSGVTLHGSIAMTALSSVAFAAAAWFLALKTTGSRRIALGAYLVCLVLPPLWINALSPDSGLFYGMAVGWFLALMTVRRSSLWQDGLALACVAITYSIRNDGVLLLLPLAAVLWQRRRLGERGATAGYAAAMLVGFCLALAPIHLLNWRVLGTAFPSGTSRALFLDGFEGFSLYRQPVNLHTLLATGAVHLLKVRVNVFALVVYRNLALGIGFAVIFLPMLLARHADPNDSETSSPEYTGPGVFLLGVLLMYTLLMPVIGEFSALRAFLGVLPLASVMVAVAIVRLTRDRRLAQALCAAVIAAYLIDGVMTDRRVVDGGKSLAEDVHTLSRELAAAGAQPATAVLMAANPVQLSVTTGYTTVTLPSNGVTAIAELAKEVGVTHVLVNASYSAAEIVQLRTLLRPVKETELSASHVLLMELPRRAP